MKIYVFNDYCHQLMGNIYYSLLQYLSNEIYPRFQTKVMSTYHRAVDLLKNPDVTTTKLPAICVDPSLPFTFEEKSNTLWRNPTASGFVTKLFDPIYQDSNIIISPGFVRCLSTVEIYTWFDSIYEQIDFNMRCLQLFRGLNRWFKPFGIEMYCPVPDKIYYKEAEELQEYELNWTPNFGSVLLETVDQEIPVVQMYAAPMVRATAINSSETRDKDSGDEYATCAMSITLEIESEVPAFYIVEMDWQLLQIDLDIIVPSVENVSNYIPRISFQYKEDPNEPTDPDVGILTPTQVVFDGLRYEDYTLLHSLVVPVDLSIEDIEMPSSILIPSNGIVVCLYQGHIVPCSWFEKDDKQYIHLDEKIDGVLNVHILEQEQM